MAQLKMVFLQIFGTLLCVTIATSSDPDPLVMDGHVTVGVLTELRHDEANSGACLGPIKGWALQEVAALEWALSTINNQSSKDFTVGLKVYDTCGSRDRMMRQTSELVKSAQDKQSPLIGIIALGSAPLISGMASFLHAYSVPLLTTRAPDDKVLSETDNVFTTAPHIHAQMQAVISVITRHRRHPGILEQDHRLGVVSGCTQALEVLENLAVKSGVEIHSTIHADGKNDTELVEDTLVFLKSQVGFQGTVIVLLQASSINRLAENLNSNLVMRAEAFWVFSILNGEPAEGEFDITKINEVFPMSVVVEPYSPILPGLNLYLQESLVNDQSVIAPLLPLLQNESTCDIQRNSKEEKKICSSSVKGSHRFLSGTRATSAVKAASSLVAAFRLVQIDRCPGDVYCKEIFQTDISKDMVLSLMKLSYNAQGSSDNIRYTADGRFVTSFIISRVSAYGLQQVGKYREDTGIVWTHPLPGMKRLAETKNEFATSDGTSTKTYSLDKKEPSLTYDYSDFDNYKKDDGIIKEILYSHQDRMGMIYALTILVWSSTGILSSIYIGIYMAFRSCNESAVRSQALGGLLLLGVICCYASCIIYVLPPTSVTCRLRILLPSISLAICFGVLLVKAMQLRAMVTLGMGGAVSQANLYITLMFTIGVQVALSLLSQKDLLENRLLFPLVELDSSGIRKCRKENLATLMMQEYLFILLIFGLALGSANRKIRKHHNEGRHLFWVTGFSVNVVAAWMLTTLLAPCMEPTATCGACLLSATSILVFVFVPKMKALFQQAQEFRHKQLTTTPSLATIFTHVDNGPIQTLRPPPPFCDPPNGMACKFVHPEAPPLRKWRLDPYDSPILRHSIPPPPPPPMRNPAYCGSSTVLYP